MKKEEHEICELPHFHMDIIEDTLATMPCEENTLSVSEIFKILGDSTRLKIIIAIMKNELCVCDISYIVGLSQSAVSHQLRILRNARLAKYKRVGKMIYYSIDDAHVSTMIQQALAHISHTNS